MHTLNRHWTERSVDDFVYRIAADFMSAIESAMGGTITQAELASRLDVSEGRVSQALNKPGNLTLKKVVEYAKAVGLKVAIVAYDDGDVDNSNGPITAEIFAKCWERLGKPADFFQLEDACKFQARSDSSNEVIFFHDYESRASTYGGPYGYLRSAFDRGAETVG